MYATDDSLPIQAFDGGTNAACFAPPLSGAWTIFSQLARAGLDRGEGCVVVSANEPADRLRADYPTLDDDAVRIIDCTRSDGTGTGNFSVASPADLTGISIALSEAYDDLNGAGNERVRLIVDSVTTLAVYAESKRLYRFVHALTQQVSDRDTLGLYVIDEPMNEIDESGLLRKLLPLFDARVQFRIEGTETTLRVIGDEYTTDWRPLDRDERRGGDSSPTSREPSVSEPSIPDSLRAMFDSFVSERLTLLVVNAPDDAVDALSASLSRLNVDVRAASLPDGPNGFALLSRGDEMVAAEPVERVRVAADGFDDDDPVDDDLSTVFSEAVSAEFGARDVGRSDLVQTSRLFERAALRHSAGTIHAGFQRLSRVTAEPRTHDLYCTLADTAVDVHLYGEDDADPDVSGATIHASDETEIRDSWFVVYDGAGDPDRMGALLCFEESPGSYNGFWTFREDFAVNLSSYLEATYGQAVSTA